ncbi:zinc finger and BTB domain-containing protein 2a [Chanos chanos]|uniref:Zinc finger and BTB domain-containing protein 2a n=1 Tax=Chanos chanos TaxID=29144 RepID=A0A6J2WJF1_CHACN|nr:zinc finger and BTB domain-containing protein 2-like [Chanos chanos]
MEMAHHGLVLLQRLNAQREFGFLCDCTVAIGDVFFKAHKAVLAAFSNYFRMLFIHQDSECVRLKPSDIQPEIFSYLLNLMYTGKLTPQFIDPHCLEQGVKFLHAYPLLQEASLLIHPESQCIPLANSLYGIQISDQACQMPSRKSVCQRQTCSVNKNEYVACDLRVDQTTFAEVSQIDMNTMNEQAQDSPTENLASHTIQNVKPGIMKRNSSSRKHYTCHQCGSHFSQRCKLREHFLHVHSSQGPEDHASPMRDGSVMELEHQGPEEDSHRFSNEVVSDNEQHVRAEDTPPPSDIADIDNLEGTDMEREVKRRKFECPTCGRKFIQKSHWREHMYIHTGKPYRCSSCGKSFCRANQAARHVCLSQSAESYTMVNKQSMVLCGGEENSQVEALFLSSSRPYKCNMCAVPFSSPSEVLKHQCPEQESSSSLADNVVSKAEGSDSNDTPVTITSEDL